MSIHECDIRDEAQVKATVADALSAHGRIDGLVNNAGGQFPAPLAAISAKGWDAVVRTNLTGGFLVARECYTQWMLSHGGAIVNIIADMWNGMPGMGHSGAARAGMLNFTETASLEWAPVRVNAVAPGWIASSGMDHYPPEMKPLILGLPKSVPLNRFGTESEVSAAIVFLLSPAAAFVPAPACGWTVRRRTPSGCGRWWAAARTPPSRASTSPRPHGSFRARADAGRHRGVRTSPRCAGRPLS